MTRRLERRIDPRSHRAIGDWVGRARCKFGLSEAVLAGAPP